MNVTKYEPWTIKQIATALKEENINNTKIVVPTFQRNLVWTDKQKKTFIDSVKKGFPIGTLLFYKLKDSDTYSLIDGLQRSSTIADFMKKPTKYFEANDIEDEIIDSLYSIMNITSDKTKFAQDIRESVAEFIGENDLTSNMLLVNMTKMIVKKYDCGMDQFDEVAAILAPCLEEFKTLYDDIAASQMPVMIFCGEESDLPTVFERINNQGTQLGKYQIYAASWAVKNYQVVVENEKLLNYIIAKYDAFIDNGFELKGYNRDELISSRTVSMFEYALGFGKFISERYPNLFSRDKDVQDINQVGFEILNACFGKHNKELKNLHERLNEVSDVNLLERRVIEVIDEVDRILKPVIQFKGNTRGNSPIYHAQNQIVSIIASTFREKYDVKNLNVEKAGWKFTLDILKVTIPQHYVYDIISHNWGEGGFGKLNSILIENKYLLKIEKTMWDAKLDGWFSGMNQRREKTNVANPKPIEKLFLNCIYLTKFTAQDQLSSLNKFDIEHLATKEAVKKQIRKNGWDGLPISSIGNLCLLPEYDNRSKGEYTIYQDSKYTNYLNTVAITIKDIEDKYTFTVETDLDWLNDVYGVSDYDRFEYYYLSFLKKRFDRMKESFYSSLKIV